MISFTNMMRQAMPDHSSAYQPALPNPPQGRSESRSSSTTSFAVDDTKVLLKATQNFTDWPSKPRPLHRAGFVYVVSGFGDALTIVASCAFFVYGVFVMHFDRLEVSRVPGMALMQDAAKYGPTIFPILFAAIVGQAMHAIAMWRLECGERLEVLDQLLGSTTIFATVTTQLKIRRLGFVSVALLVLWALSPVGGQASLRVLGSAFHRTEIASGIQYLSTKNDFLPAQEVVEQVEETDTPETIVDALVSASLLAPVANKLSPTDTWGNLKIPMIEYASDGNEADEDGWYALHTSNTVYSSLLGFPTSKLSPTSNITFAMEASYLTLNCGMLEIAEGGIPKHLRADPQAHFVLDEYHYLGNDCWGVGINFTGSMTRNQRDDDFQNNQGKLEALPLEYVSVDDDFKTTSARCTVGSSYVEVRASCIGTNCTSTHVRDSQTPYASTNWTLFDESYSYMPVMGAFGVCPFLQAPMPFQRYMWNPNSSPYNSTYDRKNGIKIREMDERDFATRLAQIFNTFWVAGIGLWSVTTQFPDLVPGSDPSNLVDTNQFMTEKTNATVTQGKTVLVCDRGWLAALFIATSMMFLAGVFGLTLEYTRMAPSIAMNISSMVRDNPHVDLPAGGTALDAAERMRKLRNARVRLGDIRVDEDVGYIAIASYSEEKFVDGLLPGRNYE